MKFWFSTKDRYIDQLEQEVKALRAERLKLVETVAEMTKPGTARRVQEVEFARKREEQMDRSVQDLKEKTEQESLPGFAE